MTLLLVLLGSMFATGVMTAATTLVGIDPNTIAFLNTVLNLIITYYVVGHRRVVRETVLPRVAQVQASVNHVEAVVDSTVPGGKRHTDPPIQPPGTHFTGDC